MLSYAVFCCSANADLPACLDLVDVLDQGRVEGFDLILLFSSALRADHFLRDALHLLFTGWLLSPSLHYETDGTELTHLSIFRNPEICAILHLDNSECCWEPAKPALEKGALHESDSCNDQNP